MYLIYIHVDTCWYEYGILGYSHRFACCCCGRLYVCVCTCTCVCKYMQYMYMGYVHMCVVYVHGDTRWYQCGIYYRYSLRFACSCCGHSYVCVLTCTLACVSTNKYSYGVAMISTLLKIIDLFCKRALQKRLYSAKETYNFKEPTNRSHPISPFRYLLITVNSHPRGRLFFRGISKRAWRKRTPLKGNPLNWSILVVVFQGGSFTGLFLWKPPKTKTPTGGGFSFDQCWYQYRDDWLSLMWMCHVTDVNVSCHWCAYHSCDWYWWVMCHEYEWTIAKKSVINIRILACCCCGGGVRVCTCAREGVCVYVHVHAYVYIWSTYVTLILKYMRNIWIHGDIIY